jgi:hypothetical protein
MGSARITLNGFKDDETIVYENAIEAGNKILANVGTVSLFGEPRVGRSRLLDSIVKGATSALIEPGLGWRTGETIGFAPTTMNNWEIDFANIVSYNNATG